MRLVYLGGWGLVLLGSLCAVAESMAHAVPHTGGFFMSAHDVWYALWPGGLVIAKIRIESLLGAWAWDPVVVTLLRAPGWALFGAPGLVLVALGWPRRRVADEVGREEEEALFLFDSLAEQVEAEAREFEAFRNGLDTEAGADGQAEDMPGEAEVGDRPPPKEGA